MLALFGARLVLASWRWLGNGVLHRRLPFGRPRPSGGSRRCQAGGARKACPEPSCEVAKLLLDRGVPVDCRKNKDGSTALQWMVNHSNLEMAEMLLQRGANQRHRDNDGDDITSYYMKRATNKEEMLALLARYA